ncbi:hypothetical protein [Myxococcus stipitatus]|uniref:hypothetical protein n=1 Tax=Myxococcus stipitatus TaxID=83455 RepID=UPI0030D3F5B8
MNPSQSRLGALSMLVVAAACAVSVAGCAASRKEAFLFDKTREHVYRKPVAEVWPQALALITEKGYSLRQTKDGFEAATEWLMQGAPSSLGTTQVRYIIRGIARGPGQCSIEYHKHVTTETRGRGQAQVEASGRPDSANFSRDPELEWELLQRVDAESATSLRAEADKIQ